MNVLVTGGGTIAPIDDVRTITNLSSGRFAASIAESCLARGAQVWHVHAPSAQLPLVRRARFDLDTQDPRAELDRLGRLHEDWKAVRGRLHLVPLRTGTVSDYAETLEHLLDYPADRRRLPGDGRFRLRADTTLGQDQLRRRCPRR